MENVRWARNIIKWKKIFSNNELKMGYWYVFYKIKRHIYKDVVTPRSLNLYLWDTLIPKFLTNILMPYYKKMNTLVIL